jgi:hypothetical protein
MLGKHASTQQRNLIGKSGWDAMLESNNLLLRKRRCCEY